MSHSLVVYSYKILVKFTGLGSRSRMFWLLGAWAGAAWKKTGAGAAQKKSGARAGAAWRKSQEPEPLKNLPAPQPCPIKIYWIIGVRIFDIKSLWFHLVWIMETWTPPPKKTKKNRTIKNDNIILSLNFDLPCRTSPSWCNKGSSCGWSFISF